MCEECDKYTPEQYDEMIKSAQEQAAYFRKIFDNRPKFEYQEFNVGGAILMIRFWPGKYDACPCGSGEKYHKCCKEFN